MPCDLKRLGLQGTDGLIGQRNLGETDSIPSCLTIRVDQWRDSASEASKLIQLHKQPVKRISKVSYIPIHYAVSPKSYSTESTGQLRAVFEPISHRQIRMWLGCTRERTLMRASDKLLARPAQEMSVIGVVVYRAVLPTGRRSCLCIYLRIDWDRSCRRAAGNTTPLLCTSACRRRCPDRKQRWLPFLGFLPRRSGLGRRNR